MNFYPAILLPVLALIVRALLVMGSPGPATMSAAASGAGFGISRSLPYVAGLVLGTGAVLCIVATGLFALLLSFPMLGTVVTVLSVLYIVYLAYRVATAPPLQSLNPSAAPPSLSAGFLLAVANPKAYVAIAAVYASGRFPGVSARTETMLSLAVLAILTLVIHVVWLLAGGVLSQLFRDPFAARVLNLVFAALLLVSVLMPFL